MVTFKSNIVLLLGGELTGHVITESKFVLCFCVCVFFLVFSLSSITAVFSKDWPAPAKDSPRRLSAHGPPAVLPLFEATVNLWKGQSSLCN